MLYYEIVCQISPETADAHKNDKQNFRDNVKAQTERFQRQSKAGKVFVSEINHQRLHLMLAIAVAQDVRRLAEAFISQLDLQVDAPLSFEEITLRDYGNAARRADSVWIEDDDDFLPDHYRRYHNRDFSESVLKKIIGKKGRRAKASALLMAELSEEMDRIAQACNGTQKPAGGHPVHYCLRVDDATTRDEAVKLLLMELIEAGRLPSKRYVEITLDEYDSIDKDDMQRAFQTAEDNALVVNCEHEGPMAEYASGSAETLNLLCRYALQYRHSVLLILCLRKENANSARYLQEEMDDASFVNIRESNVDADKAKRWLRTRARGLGAQKTTTLTRQIISDKTYSVSQLIPMVNLWRGEYLRSEVYPQYTHLTPASRDTKPIGNAYDKLVDMVGLGQAKALLMKAINLHKMRGAYARHGISQAAPSMHMVFSGNPGTAKTTVARLFAQIMKDNRLLEAGELYEVGRADLVGKYVGHTAPLVKSYFKKAKGSVLFIDEAYSLLDDRNGLYGDEAINTIVQEMERLRNEVVVILAGYKGPMEDFLQRNPGLRSRIAFHVDFPDYTQDELFAILQLMLKEQGLHLAEGAEAKVRDILRTAVNIPDFGNGRYVRNMLEQARMNQASRLSNAGDELSLDRLCLLEAEDFEAEVRMPARRAVIGF